MPYVVKAFCVSCLLLFISSSYADMTKPRFIAVSFHADWCNGCKALAPKIKQARAQANLDQSGILFVKLDLTNENTSHQAAMLAESLGISDVFNDNDGNTGYIAVIEASTGILLSRILYKDSVDEMIHSLDLIK